MAEEGMRTFLYPHGRRTLYRFEEQPHGLRGIEIGTAIETETGMGIGKGEKDVAGPETATFVNVTVNADVKETGIVKTGTGSGMDIIEMVSVSDEIEIVTVQSEGAEERTMTMIIERNV